MRHLPAAILVALIALPGLAAEPADLEFVEKRVRPVLADNCFACHGPAKQKSGLRIDSRAAMLKGGDSGPALIPKDPDNSLLIQAVRHKGDLKMPPMKPQLSQLQITDLVEWVRRGAPWPETSALPKLADTTKHWAFQPVSDPAPPRVKDASWVRTSIDRFILAKLEERSLTPSPTADKRTLIRRVTFDLTGLPPTPEEIDAFLNDNSPGAFATVVDRLLASPAYGERWARYWLDVARFADTKGYVFLQDGNFPWAYTYRDYVIRALNADLPIDRFILEQLAADHLVTANDRRALTALGFLTLGGRFMNNPHDILDDQIDVVTRGLMGLTVTCARCHDHKFDPISQKDYYALYGVFASCTDPEVPPLFEDPPKTPAYEAFQKELASREKKLDDFINSQYEQMIKGAKERVAEYWLAVHAQSQHPTQDEFMLISDGPDINPTMLKRWRAQLDHARRQHDPVLAPWIAFAALPEKEFAAKAKELALGWFFKPEVAKPINPIVLHALAGKPPATLAEAVKRYGELLNDADHLWAEARKRDPKVMALSDPAFEQLRQVFHGFGAAPNVPRAVLNDLALFPDRASQGKLQEFRKAVEQWRISGTGAPPRAHAVVDRPQPLEPHVFLRGNPNQHGPAVPRRMPALLNTVAPEPFHTGSGRLELARAIVDPRNPLTARVFVNRVWQQHFGEGLVRTPADFGLRSDPPSHPELLDHLATNFMRGGWSLKRLHREILLSATYQQQSADRAELSKNDPENRWLGRMNRHRLDFEETRDALLAVAGRLDHRVSGPSAKDIVAAQSTRRTLYGFVDRLQVPALYRAFDFPSPDATSAHRDETTIPQQALFLMNSPFVIERARDLARRSQGGGDMYTRVKDLYRLCFGRSPSTEEVELARQFLGNGSPAAWERFAQALLATDEFVFLD
jgi:mono/diheme cytochrome c family protein